MTMDRVIEKKKGIKKKHIYYFIGAIAFLSLLYMAFISDHQSVYRVEREKVTISEVENGLFNDYITIVGKVEPIRTIYLDAIEGGRVSELIIEEGTMVKKGDVILKLENQQLYQTILNSEAALAEKENYLRNTQISFESELINSRRNVLDNEYKLLRTKRKYRQYQSLIDEQLISQEEFLQAKEDYEYEVKLLEINKVKSRNDSLMRVTSMLTLKTDLNKMRATLKLVYNRLDNLSVKAPVDGQLGMLDAEIGQSIGQGTRIGMVNVLTNFKVNANIDEHYIDRVRRGLLANLERNEQNFQLSVKKVYPEVREGQFEIDLVFDGDRPENIRTGQTYHIKLELGQPAEAILLSRGGFYQSTGGRWVYVLSGDGAFAEKREIRIGKLNPQYYEVEEGLEQGEKVITSSYDLFGDNDRIVFK